MLLHAHSFVNSNLKFKCFKTVCNFKIFLKITKSPAALSKVTPKVANTRCYLTCKSLWQKNKKKKDDDTKSDESRGAEPAKVGSKKKASRAKVPRRTRELCSCNSTMMMAAAHPHLLTSHLRQWMMKLEILIFSLSIIFVIWTKWSIGKAFI